MFFRSNDLNQLSFSPVHYRSFFNITKPPKTTLPLLFIKGGPLSLSKFPHFKFYLLEYLQFPLIHLNILNYTNFMNILFLNNSVFSIIEMLEVRELVS